MKIAQVTAYWGPAYPTGSGVFCYEISKRLAEQFEVHVYSSNVGNFNNSEKIKNLYLHPLRTYGTIWDMNPLANVFTKLLRNEFEIVHVHSYIFFLSNMAALARLFKRRPKYKYLLHFNGGLSFSAGNTKNFHQKRTWAKEAIYDRTLGYFTTKMADKVLSASKRDIPIINRKFGVEEAGMEWIPNGVNTEKFVPAKKKTNHPPVVTYVGKLEKWKGIDVLIKSFERIKKEVEEVEFWVVGTGRLKEELKKTDLPLKFRGYVPYERMPEIYQETSVLLLPSYMEGFPCTCVEALSCGVPVVATDVGDTREIVVDGETGFLVKPGDAVAVARSVTKLLKDEGLRLRLGGRGREHVERNFSYDAVTEKVRRVYLDVLGERGLSE